MKENGSSRASGSVDAIRRATISAQDLLAEISRRWPGQAGAWARDPEIAAAWGRGILEARASGDQMKAALAKLTTRPYPPDLGALLSQISQMKRRAARSSLLGVLKAISGGDLSPCSAQELYALRNYPGRSWALRTEPASEGQEERWAALLEEAAWLPADQLPAVPAKPAGLLPRKLSPEEIERGCSRLAAMKAMLSLSQGDEA